VKPSPFLFLEVYIIILAFQENMFAVGMIICDGEGRLNEKSILLQGR
jgi:hypothetical protein